MSARKKKSPFGKRVATAAMRQRAAQLSAEIREDRERAKKPTITITTTPGAMAMIEHLHSTGLYGRTVEETAERLVCRAIVEQAR